MMPSLFVAHGSPALAIEDNEYTRMLSQLGQSLPRPKAIVLFSAHFVSAAQQLCDVKEYDTIYDFGGFPDALYQIRYPAKGEHRVASEIERMLTEADIPVRVNASRGLDHGAWVILRLLYPDADIPVVAMSVNPTLTPDAQYKIGATLAALREEGVLIIGSGGTVHNLGALRWGQSGIDEWAKQFDEWLEEHLKAWDLESLYEYDVLAPGANLAVPPRENEHFVPLFYAVGAADGAKTATLLHRSYQYGNLSQSVWQFGV